MICWWNGVPLPVSNASRKAAGSSSILLRDDATHRIYLTGGIVALQNLQITLSRFLLLGITWSLLHSGQVRFRPSMVPITAEMINGFMILPDVLTTRQYSNVNAVTVLF